MKNPDNMLRQWRAIDIKVLRFAVGMTLISVLAYTVAWPMSFMTVLISGKLLMANKSILSFKEGFGLLLIVIIALYSGFLVSVAFITYPLLFVLMITLALLRIFYLARKGKPDILIIMLLVGVTVIPMLAMQSQFLAYEAVKMLVFSIALAVLFSIACFALIPGGGIDDAEEKPASDEDALRGAIKSTLVVMPLYLYIFFTNTPGALLILIFVAILAQDTSLDKGLKSGAGLFLGNLIGGLIGIVIYNLLVMVPSLVFFILLMALTWLLIGQQVFKPGMLGILFGIGFATINVVLSSALGFFSEDASTAVYQRLLQLTLVTVYIIMSFSVVDYISDLLLGKEKQNVQPVR